MDRFLMSLEPFIQKCRSLAKARNLYLDVVAGRVRLAWTGSTDDDSIDFMERADAIGLAYHMIRSSMLSWMPEVQLMLMAIIPLTVSSSEGSDGC